MCRRRCNVLALPSAFLAFCACCFHFRIAVRPKAGYLSLPLKGGHFRVLLPFAPGDAASRDVHISPSLPTLKRICIVPLGCLPLSYLGRLALHGPTLQKPFGLFRRHPCRVGRRIEFFLVGQCGRVEDDGARLLLCCCARRALVRGFAGRILALENLCHGCRWQQDDAEHQCPNDIEDVLAVHFYHRCRTGRPNPAQHMIYL